jgi:hypothetical protein
MIPHNVQRNRCHAARFGAEPGFRFFNFGQIVGQNINPPVHKNPLNDVCGVILGGIAAYEIGKQIAGKGAVSEVSEMQVSEKIHAIRYPDTASCCSQEVWALD